MRCHACLSERGPAPAPLAPRRSDRRPPPLQIDVSGFVVHEQLQLSVRNDGPDAAPSLLLCDRNLARAAYLEVRGPIPGCAAGTGSARSMQRRRRLPPPLHSLERLHPCLAFAPSPFSSLQIRETASVKDAAAPKLAWKAVAAPAGAPAGVACREVTLPKPLAKKGSAQLTALAAYTHVLRPEPAEVGAAQGWLRNVGCAAARQGAKWGQRGYAPQAAALFTTPCCQSCGCPPTLLLLPPYLPACHCAGAAAGCAARAV